MPTVFETGHAKNVANFEDLISVVTGYGATYNPTKAALKLATLNTQFTQAKSDILAVTTKLIAFNNATNARMLAFASIKSLSTRLVNAFLATDATTEMIKDAKTINRKIQGVRAKNTTTPTAPDAPAPTTISSSQQSYDQIIENFNKLVELLKTEASYAPNETDLKSTTLASTISGLKTANTNVGNAYTAITNARIARDKTLYKVNTGLVPVALAVKAYVKSLYGASSPEFKQINKIAFKVIVSK